MDIKRLLVKLAEEPEAPFRPVIIGDPVRLANSTSAIRPKAALATGGVWMAGALFWGQVLNAWNRRTINKFDSRTDPYEGLKGTPDYDKAKKHDKIIMLARLLSAGGVGALGSIASDIVGGSHYNYMGYKVPRDPSDVVIAFTGGASGAHRAKKGRGYDLDVADLDRRYGKNRYALFNYRHLDEAKDFLMNLPPGCRIRIQGHSFGGPSAFKLAQFASDNGIAIDRLDTLDPIGFDAKMKISGKPELVKRWTNHIPDQVRPWYWPDLLGVIGGHNRVLPGPDETRRYSESKYDDHTGIRIVDYEGDKERNLRLDYNADDPLSPFTAEGLIRKDKPVPKTDDAATATLLGRLIHTASNDGKVINK